MAYESVQDVRRRQNCCYATLSLSRLFSPHAVPSFTTPEAPPCLPLLSFHSIHGPFFVQKGYPFQLVHFHLLTLSRISLQLLSQAVRCDFVSNVACTSWYNMYRLCFVHFRMFPSPALSRAHRCCPICPCFADMGNIILLGEDDSHADGWTLRRIHDSKRIFNKLTRIVQNTRRG